MRTVNIEKKKEYMAAYRAANKEKISAKQKEYREKNKENLSLYRRNYYSENSEYWVLHREKNPEKQISYSTKWKIANKQRVNLYSKTYREENPEKVKAAKLSWSLANKHKFPIYGHNYRCSKKNTGKLSKGLSEKLYRLQKGKCPCCKKALGTDFHIDHIMPLSLGGLNTDDNIQLLRSKCNLQKGSKHPVDFMQSRGFLL